MSADISIDVDHLVGIALDEPDEEGDCLRCACTMSRPEPELEPTPLCHLCAQALLPILAREAQRLRHRDAAWQRATRVDDPGQVSERNVRLCSCDDADLPQVGDEIDACETCDGMVKASDDEPAGAAPTPAPRAQWVSRGLRCPFGVQCDRKDACRLWHPLPGNPYAFLPPAEETLGADPRESNDAGGGP